MEIVLVRHSETEWSRDMRHTGRTDIPLTERGREEARMLSEALREWSFGRVLVSPLSRASKPASWPAWTRLRRSAQALLEWDYGEYEGITTAEIRAQSGRLVPVARRLSGRRDRG